MEENFSVEWNMEWKICSLKWKWNERKLPVRNMEKSSSIPFHTMLCRQHKPNNRGGVLDDVLGLEDVLDDTF